MGGMIVGRSAELEPQVADGVILLAPMISIERVTNKGINWLLVREIIVHKLLLHCCRQQKVGRKLSLG